MKYSELKKKLLQLDVADDAEVELCTEQSDYAVEDCSYCIDPSSNRMVVTLYTKEGLKAFFDSIYRKGSNNLNDILEEI